MSTAVLNQTLGVSSLADKMLKAAVRFWFMVILIGQLIFSFTVASFYGLTAMRGNLAVWNKVLAHGYIPGDRLGTHHSYCIRCVYRSRRGHSAPSANSQSLPRFPPLPGTALHRDGFLRQSCGAVLDVGARNGG